MKFRHEWKHRMEPEDWPVLRSRLQAVLQPDSHGREGQYLVRSLYFDNLQDKALKEKIEGVNGREKYRLRYYNEDTSFIMLEKKIKHNGLCRKVQQQISEEEARSFIDGNRKVLQGLCRERDGQDGQDTLLRELCHKMEVQGLMARTVVEYRRTAFVYQPGNVRVTLDTNIRTAVNCRDFLQENWVSLPVRETFGILEVKWDEFLPDFVRDLLQSPALRTSSFSKYAACRIYG